MRLFAACLAAIYLFSHPLQATIWTPEEYPNPVSNPSACGRAESSFLCDPDQILTANGANAIEEFLREQLNTEVVTCPTPSQRKSGKHGVQMAVALVRKMDTSRFRKEFAAKHFAKTLHDNWGVGEAKCNNGLVLFLSKNDRFMYISTGAGVKSAITDKQAHLVIEDMKELLRANQYDAALLRGLENLANILDGKPLSEPSWWFSAEAFVLYVILAVVAFLLYRSYKEQAVANEARNRLSRQQREDERNRRARRFAQESCPICLDTFEPDVSTQILDCGHKFCTECLAQWENTQQRTRRNGYRSTCPICREVIEDEKTDWRADLGRAMGGSERCERRNVGNFMMDALLFDRLLNADRNFRLRRLNRLYPTYVTTGMVNDIQTGRYTGTWTDHPTFQPPPQPRHGGFGGSGGGGGFSFGGGSSSGGGGSGGGW